MRHPSWPGVQGRAKRVVSPTAMAEYQEMVLLAHLNLFRGTEPRLPAVLPGAATTRSRRHHHRLACMIDVDLAVL